MILRVAHGHKSVVVVTSIVVNENGSLLAHITIEGVNPQVWSFGWINFAFGVSWVGTLNNWALENLRHGSEGGPV